MGEYLDLWGDLGRGAHSVLYLGFVGKSLAATVEQRAPLLPFSCPHQENDNAVPELPMLLCSVQMF